MSFIKIFILFICSVFNTYALISVFYEKKVNKKSLSFILRVSILGILLIAHMIYSTLWIKYMNNRIIKDAYYNGVSVKVNQNINSYYELENKVDSVFYINKK